ncbi:G-type lectin S-receptor-like serine/threonine-protein kinase [Rosa sericea]
MKMRKKMPLIHIFLFLFLWSEPFIHSYTIENAEKMFLKALLLFLLFRFCTSRDTIKGNEEQLKDVVDGDYLVSKQSKFELGFFSPGNSSNRYVGIWYSQTRVSNKTVVWVANRNNPINDTSGVLKINRYGELVLYAYNMESTPIWSTNVSPSVQNVNRSTLSAQLLDTGNLVVFQDDKNEISIWQSFDYPTHTLIVGMKVGVNWKTGLEWVLTSWKSQDDPGTGDYTFRLHSDQTASPQYFMYKGLSKYWRSDPGPGPTLVTIQEETYYLLNYTDGITRMTLTDSELDVLTWDDGGLQWKKEFSTPKSRCDWYGQCGANSKCFPDNVNLFECDCLPGYEPSSINDWNQKNGSGGCVSKRVGLSKCGNGDGFVNLARVKYPDASIASRSRTGMSAKECEQDCLRNCSCTAYLTIENEGLVDCLTWYDDLMDILEFTEFGRDLYVRVDHIELAENARKSKGFLERRGMLAIPTLCALLALVLIIMCACSWHKKKRNTTEFVEADELEETKRHPELQFFDLNTLMAATDNFSHVNELGQGGFGSVYKGQLPNEQKVAVKRLSKTSGQGTEEFKNEVALIAGLQHRNLVKLLGCCIKGEERMLVLEYMPNKSLDSFLFDHRKRSFLDWEKRFEIINGIARGILYLHQDSRLRIIHRDLKTSNVLLDSEMNPKISDFGMARIFDGDQVQNKTKRVVGTYGYMSPEYAVFGRFSTKSDVFSFGIILLEVVSGKRSNGFSQEDPSMNLIRHVWDLWREDRALEIVDTTLELYNSDEVMRCIQVALLCVQEESEDRPAMSAIVFMLSGETSPPSPNQPAYVFRRNSSTDAESSVPKRLYSINDLTITAMEAR